MNELEKDLAVWQAGEVEDFQKHLALIEASEGDWMSEDSEYAEQLAKAAAQNTKCPRCGFVTANVFACETCRARGANLFGDSDATGHEPYWSEHDAAGHPIDVEAETVRPFPGYAEAERAQAEALAAEKQARLDALSTIERHINKQGPSAEQALDACYALYVYLRDTAEAIREMDSVALPPPPESAGADKATPFGRALAEAQSAFAEADKGLTEAMREEVASMITAFVRAYDGSHRSFEESLEGARVAAIKSGGGS